MRWREDQEGSSSADAGAEGSSREQVAQPSSARYLSLDFWRGLACLGVVVCHSTYYAAYPGTNALARMAIGLSRRGWLGVPIFFVISGYCIMVTADSTRRRNLSTKEYFLRRFRRIYPPYWIWLAVAALTIWLFETQFGPALSKDPDHAVMTPVTLTAWEWFGNLSLIETWRSHVIGEEQRMYLLHAWSLCYEEQFYAVAGLALLFFRKRFFAFFVTVSLGILALHVAEEHFGFDTSGFFFDGRWLVFAGGIIVYYILTYASPRARRFWCGVLALGLLYSLRPHALALTLANDWIPSLFAASAFALLLVFLRKYDAAIHSSRFLRPITWHGKMCYSLYLTHWPVVRFVSALLARAGLTSCTATVLVTVPVCLAIASPIAWGFHCLVERHFLNKPS